MRIGLVTALIFAVSCVCAIASGSALLKARALARYPRQVVIDIPFDLSHDKDYAGTFDVDLEGDYDVEVIFVNATHPRAIQDKLGTSVFDASDDLPRIEWAVETNGSRVTKQKRLWRGATSYALGAIHAQSGTTYTLHLQAVDPRPDLIDLGPHVRIALDPFVRKEYIYQIQYQWLACGLWGFTAFTFAGIGAVYSRKRGGASRAPHNYRLQRSARNE